MIWRKGSEHIQAGEAPTLIGDGYEVGRFLDYIVKTIPKYATPGDWCYLPSLYYNCPDGEHTIIQPPACIEVTNPPQDKG